MKVTAVVKLSGDSLRASWHPENLLGHVERHLTDQVGRELLTQKHLFSKREIPVLDQTEYRLQFYFLSHDETSDIIQTLRGLRKRDPQDLVLRDKVERLIQIILGGDNENQSAENYNVAGPSGFGKDNPGQGNDSEVSGKNEEGEQG
jgi:hypothetical protein